MRLEFSTAETERPYTTEQVEWVGPVEPKNAINYDTWVSTA